MDAPRKWSAGKQIKTLRITAGAQETRFAYDPQCTLANAWHFDNLEERTQIVPCEQTCKALQSEAADSFLRVDFACILPIAT